MNEFQNLEADEPPKEKVVRKPLSAVALVSMVLSFLAFLTTLTLMYKLSRK